MVGWDEVLQPSTPKDVVIQSWRGPQFVGEAVRGGNRAMLSAGYYIDLNQSAAEHYAADPEGEGPTTLSSDESKRILGGEATMWSEFVTPENVDSRIWPRTAAIAERLWSPRDIRDVSSMYARLAIISQHLNYYGLEHNSSYPAMLSRMTGEPDPLPLRVFGDVMQPPREYARGDLRHYDAFTPLNRMVDAVPPESDTARQFLDMVNRIVRERPAPRIGSRRRNGWCCGATTMRNCSLCCPNRNLPRSWRRPRPTCIKSRRQAWTQLATCANTADRRPGGRTGNWLFSKSLKSRKLSC